MKKTDGAPRLLRVKPGFCVHENSGEVPRPLFKPGQVVREDAFDFTGQWHKVEVITEAELDLGQAEASGEKPPEAPKEARRSVKAGTYKDRKMKTAEPEPNRAS